MHKMLTLQEFMPEPPAAVRKRYLDLGLPVADVHILTEEKPCSEYYDAALEAGAPPKLAANWVLGDVMAYSKVPRLLLWVILERCCLIDIPHSAARC